MLNRLMGMPESASEHGFLVDHMLEFCHWFMLILFVGWSFFFFFTLIRFHHRRHPRADYHGVKTKASTHIEFMVVLLEAVLLIGFAIPLWARRVSDFPKDDAPIIRVIGQQFQWNFHYPGPDGKFGKQAIDLISATNQIGLDRNDPEGKDDIVVSNELHLPVNHPVILQITSKDVIHSLSLQSMRAGQDAIPGTMVPMWFRPIKTSPEDKPFEIICGQLCGLGHYSMRGAMIVQAESEYNGWLQEMAALNAPAPAAAAAQPAGPGATPSATGSSGSVPQPSKEAAGATVKPEPQPAKSPASSQTSEYPHK
jgi:cytochrome c oxidase subunit 2